MKKNHQWNLSYFAIAFVMLTLVQFLFIERRVVQSIPYSQFLQLLNEQKLSDLRVEKDQISGKLQERIDGHHLFSTVRVDPALAADLAQSGVGFTGVNENTFLNGLLGYTLQRPTEDHFLISCQMLKDRIAVLMAGRAAEFLAYGQISTGAADDLGRATDIARQLITRFGMSTELGQSVLERQNATYLGEHMQGGREKDYSEQTAREIDLGIRALLDEAYHRTQALLESRRSDLDAGARLLLEKETLTPEEFPALMPSKPAPAPYRLLVTRP